MTEQIFVSDAVKMTESVTEANTKAEEAAAATHQAMLKVRETRAAVDGARLEDHNNAVEAARDGKPTPRSVIPTREAERDDAERGLAAAEVVATEAQAALVEAIEADRKKLIDGVDVSGPAGRARQLAGELQSALDELHEAVGAARSIVLIRDIPTTRAFHPHAILYDNRHEDPTFCLRQITGHIRNVEDAAAAAVGELSGPSSTSTDHDDPVIERSRRRRARRRESVESAS
ncbi:MAG TPA: hypothetical protein VJL81_11210 [Solirubrobacterales bacterium]|nr:hypothetical protein [Solirubrobacterales bacterium]